MKKQQIITYISIAIIIILLNSLSLCIFAIEGNDWRINTSNSLYNRSASTQTLHEKLFLLIQSDVLAPSEAKKYEIANIYLELDDFGNAMYYLKRIDNQSGYLKIAESALEKNEFTVASEYISKIDDDNKRKELDIFSEIIRDENKINNIKNLPLEPQTNLGVILKALNTNNFDNVTANTLLGKKIADIREKYPEKIRSGLIISNILVQEKQPVLARLILNIQESEHPGITDVYVIKARSYAVQNDYVNGLKYQLLAINTNPADITLYNTALQYAEAAGDTNESTSLKENIGYLESIKK